MIGPPPPRTTGGGPTRAGPRRRTCAAPPRPNLALDQRGSLGCIGVVTDAKPDAVAFYLRYGFERLEGVREGALHGETTAHFLTLGAAYEARRG